MALEKICAFKFLKGLCFYFFALFLNLISCIKTFILPEIGDHIFYTVFPELFFFVFFATLKKSRNMLKLRGNCKTPLFTPLEIQFWTKKLKNVLLPQLKRETCSKGDILKILRRKITDLKNQGPNKSQFCKKWAGALNFRENGLAITFTWPNGT